ncbi:hypothetical protein TRFO_22297 [Tritrichomonas foetus]|uniref:Uncharacterized protein n=1 Tax=Tritrichomonas foetus TaxID=1144522 RepID=A0A1J4KGN8_9EUKA|nr:hypothetical protein TRFO_22297 [Tritrichomonas foetus]|eukprot:OHT08964.1 hypothetical protein TRFO_22297 [Tritrichomonas foetus]
MYHLYSLGKDYSLKEHVPGLHEIENSPSNLGVFACAEKFGIFYSLDGFWQGLGENSNGELGPYGEFSSPHFVPLPSFSGISPRMISCGLSFTAFTDLQGTLFAVGGKFQSFVPIGVGLISFFCCRKEILAIPKNKSGVYLITATTSFKHFCPNERFIDCAIGSNHYVVLTEAGQVFTWGTGDACGQGPEFCLGIPTIINYNFISQFVRVFACDNQTILVDNKNHIWAAGQNDKSQLGFQSSTNLNRFVKVDHSDFSGPIQQIAFTNSNIFILDTNGEVYVSGNKKCLNLLPISLSNNVSFEISGFNTLINKNNSKICFISSSSKHIMFGVGQTSLFHHPAMMDKSEFGHQTVITQMKFYNEKFYCDVDVSDACFAFLGVKRNQIMFGSKIGTIQVLGMLNSITIAAALLNNTQGSVNKQLNSENLSYNENNNVIINEKQNVDSYEIVEIKIETPIVLHKGFSLIHLENPHDFIKCITRSGMNFSFDTSDQSCRQFGFLSGERVHHTYMGDGTVLGTYGNTIWFVFDNDQSKASQGNKEMTLLHNLLEISSNKRSVTSLSYKQGVINVEVAPCNFLNNYGLLVDDIVMLPDRTLGQICGEFGYYCAVHSFQRNCLETFLPSAIKLLRRENSEFENSTIFGSSNISSNTSICPTVAFDGSIVDVDVSFNSQDILIPLDRILTPKGFATVIGKEISNKSDTNNLNNSCGYWIQTDDALILNLGITLIRDISKVKIIRRLLLDEMINEIENENGINVSANPFEESKIYPGDIFIHEDNNKYILLGYNDFDAPISQNIDANNDDHQQYIFEIPKEPNILYSVFQSTFLIFTDENGKAIRLQTNLEAFQGIGIKPCDLVSYNEIEMIVIGINNGDIFLQKLENKEICIIQQKDLYINDLYRVTKRFGIGLDIY